MILNDHIKTERNQDTGNKAQFYDGNETFNKNTILINDSNKQNESIKSVNRVHKIIGAQSSPEFHTKEKSEGQTDQMGSFHNAEKGSPTKSNGQGRLNQLINNSSEMAESDKIKKVKKQLINNNTNNANDEEGKKRSDFLEIK